ncbi:MAG TPA: hypothetical protein PLJ94_04610, partial [Methylotenera sp.]|nr:hypothetical protein [Methylotenera sp.]HPH07940.1 hypothetical protein [Methylotenera sp.]
FNAHHCAYMVIFKLASTVNNLKTSRPFQQYTLKGRYFDVLNFVNALQNFDRQVTVIKVDIFATNQTPMPGVPQPITATLILAL